MTAPAVLIEGLAAGYGGRPVIGELSFAVERGELFGLLGPNGAGKSTLLRVLSGVVPPARGRVVLLGRPLPAYTRRELSRTVAVVPQGAFVDLPFTVAEVVLMGRTPHLRHFSLEGPRDVAVARQAMEETGILHLVRRPVHSLSGGERQRAFIARALAQEPEVLLLDEPTAFLDIGHQLGLFALLRRLRRAEGLTIVAALHDINLAAAHCSRMGFMREGSLVAVGRPREVITGEMIRQVYGADVRVVHDVGSGVPVVLPFGRVG